MAKIKCPKCGSEVPAEDGWAKAALSTTIAAPAVPDMATQVRCPSCQVVFAQSDVIYAGASATHRLRTIAWVGIFVAVAWVLYQFVVR
jgi:ribosomal protein S27E